MLLPLNYLALLLFVGSSSVDVDAKHTPRRRHHNHGHHLERGLSPATACTPKTTSTSAPLNGNLLVANGHWQLVTISQWIADPTTSVSSAVISSSSSPSTTAISTSTATTAPTSISSQSSTPGVGISIGISIGTSPTTSASGPISTSKTPAITTKHTDKHVLAHFMVGIVSTYKQSDWESDIRLAKSKGITGFACNIGLDWYTQAQLDLAFLAAAAVGDFGICISFDFNWYTISNTTGVSQMMQRYIDQQAHITVDGKPFVSTFIGDGFDWSQVAKDLGREIYAVPFWQASAADASNPGVSGLFSWAAWPGQLDNVPVNEPMDDSRDLTYLGYTNAVDKVYMAPVSSWFFTHFGKEVPYAKNWVFKSETLWFDRWEEILKLNNQLNFIELVTWNDYGESHYIGPYDTPHTDDGSAKWAAGLDHTAMLDFAVPYINAFKAGSSTPIIETEMLVYWHRPHLKSAECDSTDNVGSKPTGWEFLSDVVFVASMTKFGGLVSITSGSNAPVVQTVPAGVHMMHFPMGTGSQHFSLTTLAGTVATGTSNVSISAGCWNGIYNYNYHAGSVICG